MIISSVPKMVLPVQEDRLIDFSSYRFLQRDPEVLPTDLRVIRAFFESHGESYSSPLCLDCALFRVLGYTDRYDEKRNG